MTTLITIITSVLAALAANQWAFPWIGKIYKEFRDRKINKEKAEIEVEKELIEVDGLNNDIYEKQINFFVAQVEVLRTQLSTKQQEMDEMSIQLNNLRKQILDLQETIFQEKTKNSKLKEHACYNVDCLYRIKNNTVNQ